MPDVLFAPVGHVGHPEHTLETEPVLIERHGNVTTIEIDGRIAHIDARELAAATAVPQDIRRAA
jgi:hypothetical protein